MTTTKKIIRDNAINLFSLHGFEGVSLQTLANSCGVSKSAIFHYYQSKFDIALDAAQYINSMEERHPHFNWMFLHFVTLKCKKLMRKELNIFFNRWTVSGVGELWYQLLENK